MIEKQIKFKMIKRTSRFFKNIYSYIVKIKWIKALLAFIGILMSYKLIRYFIKFNKFIIYLLGLIIVGFNWQDYQIINDIKLGYDSLKLHVLSYFNQENDFIKDKVNKTEKDIKQIVVKEQQNLKSNDKLIEVPKPQKKILVEKVDNEKVLFKSLREKYLNTDQVTIGDGLNNEWSLSSILKNPLIIASIIALIMISGVIVISIYDISLDTIKHLPLDLAKMSWAGISFLFWKIINLFRRNRRGPGSDGGSDNSSEDITLNAGNLLGPYNLNYLPDKIDPSDRFFKPHFMDSRTWLNLLDQVEARENDDTAIRVPYGTWIKKLAEASVNEAVSRYTSTETNEDIMVAQSRNSSEGSNTPRASGSNIQLPEQENPFAEIPKTFKGKNISTPQQQAEYFNSKSPMKNDSILF